MELSSGGFVMVPIVGLKDYVVLCLSLKLKWMKGRRFIAKLD